MKIQISFLFFYLLWPCLMINNMGKASSQTIADSTIYYQQLALNPEKNSDLVSAYNYFIKHKKWNLDKRYPEGAIFDLNMLTIIQKQLGLYHDSEASAIEAITLLDNLEISEFSIQTKISLYNELGKINRMLKEYPRALMFYDKAFELTTKPKDQNRIINNRAFIYIETNDYHRAKSELQKAYDISIKIEDDIEIARNLDNIGFVESKLNEPTALQKLENALEKRIALNDIEGQFASYKHLVEYYKDRNDPSKSQSYLKKALAISNQLNSDAYMFDALSYYVEFSDDSLVRTYKLLNDKIRLENMLVENKFASKKYDYSKKELEAERSKIAKERTQMLILLLVIIGIFMVFFIKAKHKKDNIQQVFKTETRISKKIHDELANDVSDIMSFVENQLETSQENKTKLLNELEDVYLRTRDISTETASIDFVNFAQSLKHLLIQHNKPNVRVIVNDVNTIDWQRISEHKKLAVYRCLQELMVNMKKHSNAHLVSVVFKNQKNSNEIRYTDDGDGFDIEKINANGLTNAEYRMKEAGGDFKFETSKGKGFKATITFKS